MIPLNLPEMKPEELADLRDHAEWLLKTKTGFAMTLPAEAVLRLIVQCEWLNSLVEDMKYAKQLELDGSNGIIARLREQVAALEAEQLRCLQKANQRGAALDAIIFELDHNPEPSKLLLEELKGYAEDGLKLPKAEKEPR